MRLGPRRAVPVSSGVISLSSTTIGRFTGGLALTVTSGGDFSPDSVVRIDGVSQTTVYSSPGSISCTTNENVTWTAGAKTVTVFTASTGITTNSAVLTVTQHASLRCEADCAGATSSAGNVTGVPDLSGLGYNLTVAAGTPTLAATSIGGRTGVAFAGEGDALRMPAASAFSSASDYTTFRVLKPTTATVVEKGIPAFEIESGTSESYFTGYASGLLTGDTWAFASATASVSQRLGAALANFSWAAGEVFIEEARTTSGSGNPPILRKNGTNIALTLSAGTGGATSRYAPASVFGTANINTKIHGSGQGSTDAGVLGYMLFFNAQLSDAVCTQVRRYLNSLFFGTADVKQVTSVSSTSGNRWSGSKIVTVNGTGFVNGDVIQFNGGSLATTFLSATQLQCTLPASAHWENGLFFFTVVGAVDSALYTVAYGSNALTHQRADQGITVSSGSLVSTWANLVGSDTNKNLTQATAGNQFSVVTAQANGQTCLRSAGGRYMRPGTFSTAPSQPITRFFVGLSAANQNVYDGLTGTTRNVLFTSAGGAGVGFAGATLQSSSMTTLGVTAVVFNGASSSIRTNKRTANATGTIGTQNATGFTLGADYSNSGPMVGDVYEVITISGALTDTEIGLILDYIASRYAITLAA